MKPRQRIRVGDIVKYENKIGMVKGTSRDWYCIRGCVDIDNVIVRLEDVIKIIIRREKLKNWWEYLNRSSKRHYKRIKGIKEKEK